MSKTTVQSKPTLKAWWLGKGADLAGGAIIALALLVIFGAWSFAVVTLWRTDNPGFQMIAFLAALGAFAGVQLIFNKN